MYAHTVPTKLGRALGVVIAGATAAVLLGAGAAQAAPDAGHQDDVAKIADRVGLGGPDTRPGGSVNIGNPNDLPPLRGFNPQPDPPRAPTVDVGSKN
jgi:hypothetical protein